MNGSAVRIGLRLARRELKARPARAALVVLLIIVPTAAMTVVTTFFRTSEFSRETLRAADFGSGAYRAYFAGTAALVRPGHYSGTYEGADRPSDPQIDALRKSVPAGTPFLVERSAIDRVRNADFARTFQLTDIDLTNPLVRGRYTLTKGRVPSAPSEAVINSQLADELHLHIGSVFTPQRLGVELTVVGIMRAGLGYADYVATPAPLPPSPNTNVFIGAAPMRPEADGWSVTPANASNTSHTDRVLWTYVGGTVGFFVVGTIVAAAFALGTRRQLRTIGLLSSSGASPRVIAWALTAQGAVSGAVGSVVGIGLGVVGVHLLPLHVLQSITARQALGPVIHPIELLPIAVIGTMAAMGAAAFPARTAAGLPTLQALASRRPITTPRRGSWLAAALLLATGSVMLSWAVKTNDVRQSAPAMLVAVIACVLPFIAALVAAPLVVARLEQLSAKASLPWRLAGRSLARNRARSSSVVGATCAVVGVVIAASTLLHSWNPRSAAGYSVYDSTFLHTNQVIIASDNAIAPSADGTYPDDAGPPAPATSPVDEAELARVRAVIPAAQQIDLTALRQADGFTPPVEIDADVDDQYAQTQFGSYPTVAVASPALLALFGVGPELRARLAAGDAVAVRMPGAPKLRPNNTTLRSSTLHIGGTVVSRQAALYLPRVLVSAETAKRHGWTEVPAAVTLFVADHAFTPRETRRLRLIDADLSWEREVAAPPAPNSTFRQTYITVGESPSRLQSPMVIRLLGFAATALFVLAVVGIGLGLSARDNEDERAVLDAVGAEPRVRRLVGTRRALLLVVVACVIALPAALVPVSVLISVSDHSNVHYGVDWIALLGVTIGLPLVIAAVTSFGGWSRDRIRRPQPEVFGFAD